MKTDLPTFVILGTRTDFHVECVATLLEQQGQVRVVVMDYHDDTRFWLEVDEHGGRQLTVNDHVLPDHYLVWDRRKILPGTELYIKGDETGSGYAAQEWRAFYTLICGFNKGYVVNALESRACMIKPYQQAIAAGVGFLVPPSLVCNDRNAAMQFQSRHDNKIIVKSISGGKIKPASEGESIPYIIMTMRVSMDDLIEATDAEVAYCPHFFQAEIHKSHELRVVYVDGKVMSFRVNSQVHKLAELDWRKGMEVVPFFACEIDDDLAQKITAFMKAMDLFSGSLDIIVDKKGRPWFLECNQDGAWGWLDDVSNGDVARAFAAAFSKRLGVTFDVNAIDHKSVPASATFVA